MPRGRGYRYSVESSSWPVCNYVGELRVEDNGDDTSVVIWSADFDVTYEGESNNATTLVEDFFKAVLNQLKHFYG